MICPRCNSTIQDDSKFCSKCGFNLELRLEDKKIIDNEPIGNLSNSNTNDNSIVTSTKSVDSFHNKKFLTIFCAVICLVVSVIIILVYSLSCHHNWVDASCESPMTCSLCGKTKGDALGHEWVEATCTAAKTCSVCKKTEGKALGHNVEYKITKAATCSEAGQKEGTCSRCNVLMKEEIEQIEHTPSGEWVVESKGTLENPVTKNVQYCKVCGQVALTESVKMTDEEIKSAMIKACKTYTYKEILRNPESYKGKYAHFKGEVTQVCQDETDTEYAIYRISITYDYYWTDAIMVIFEGSLEDNSRLIEDDIVNMYGVLDGTYTYETVLGSTLTIPLFRAKYIDRVN